MWKHRFDRHCSDDRLLAFLDGELHGLARLRTARHLRRCWECRAHLSGLEHQAESLARLMEKQTASQSGRTAEARAAVLAG
jgi:anti-sigma factor RsiW